MLFQEAWESLVNHKPKHKLKYKLEICKYPDGDNAIHFTIFDKDNTNNHIYIYSFDNQLEKKNKVQAIKKLLNNKSKALTFIYKD